MGSRWIFFCEESLLSSPFADVSELFGRKEVEIRGMGGKRVEKAISRSRHRLEMVCG